MPSGLETLIGGMFQTVLGSPIMIGLVGLFIFMVIGVIFKLAFEGLFVMLFSYVVLLGAGGYLPAYIFYAVIIGCGLIIFMALMRLVNR